MTTVDETTYCSDVLADGRVVRLGHTMSFGRATLSSTGRQQSHCDDVQRLCYSVSPVW
jgi:hypothetical protein